MLNTTRQSAGDLCKAYLRRVIAIPALQPWQPIPVFLERYVASPANRTLPVPQGRLALSDALALSRDMVLSGEAGAGKTTLLLTLARTAAQRVLREMPSSSSPIPIYVALRDLTWETGLHDLIAAAVCQQSPGNTWRPGTGDPLLFLLDGLDEVPPERLDGARRLIAALKETAHHVIISTTPEAYDEGLTGDSPAFSLLPLDPADVAAYLRQALGESGMLFYKHHVQRNKRMLGLAANPLMLALMSTAARAQARLSAQPARLLHQFVTRAINPAAVGDLTARALAAGLARLGFAMRTRRIYSASTAEVEDWQQAPARGQTEGLIAQAAQCGLIASRVPGRLEFTHPMLVHYFAALSLSAEIRRGRSLAATLGERLLDGEWNDVVTMLTGVTDHPVAVLHWLASALQDPEQLVEQVMAHDLQHIDHPRAQSERRRDWAEQLRDNAAQVLAAAGGAGVNELVTLLSNPDPNARWHAIELIGQFGPPALAAPLALSARDPNLWVRKAAVDALMKLSDPAALEPVFAILRESGEASLSGQMQRTGDETEERLDSAGGRRRPRP